MATIDRSKYKRSDSAELQKVTEEMKEREISNSRGSFIKIEPGINVLRIFPAPVKAKSSLYLFPKVTSFLPFLEDEVDKNGNKTGKQVIKRKAVFNAKVHGNMEHDLVEEYMAAVREKFAESIKDTKELNKKLKVVTDWKTGIKPTSAWVVYAYKKVGEKKVYGRLQITDGVKKKMDTLCMRQGEAGKAIIVDCFTDIETGKEIQWISNPNDEDIKNRNQVNVLFDENAPLTDEELEMLESWDSLESLYTDCYTHNDFERELKGLERFDKDNKLGVFDSLAFQSIIDTCKEEVIEKLGDVNSEDKDNTSSSNVPTSNNSSSSDEDEIPTILSEMDKNTLKELVSSLELDLKLKNTFPPSKMRKLIKESIIKTYELEGDSVSINEQITDIIENSFEDTSKDNEENNKVEPSSEETEEEPTTDKKPKTKASALLEKYRHKNG